MLRVCSEKLLALISLQLPDTLMFLAWLAVPSESWGLVRVLSGLVKVDILRSRPANPGGQNGIACKSEAGSLVSNLLSSFHNSNLLARNVLRGEGGSEEA